MDQDINLKFSEHVHHMSELKWTKKSVFAQTLEPTSMQNLWTSLVTVFVKKNWKKIGEVLNIFELPHERIVWYLEENGVSKFFEQFFCPEPVVHE